MKTAIIMIMCLLTLSVAVECKKCQSINIIDNGYISGNKTGNRNGWDNFKWHKCDDCGSHWYEKV